MFNQDLHIHTTYSKSDSSVVPEQTIAFVAAVKHARVVLFKGDLAAHYHP
jgi:predicted metal-dependent phosphoesterase TrpH